jgi:hypothetical protein
VDARRTRRSTHREAHRRESRPRRWREALARDGLDRRARVPVKTESPGFRRSFEPDTAAPAAARRELERLRSRVGDDLLERCQLVATELLTNSVRHADLERGQEITMEVLMLPGVLRIEVTDQGQGFDQAAVEIPEPGSSTSWRTDGAWSWGTAPGSGRSSTPPPQPPQLPDLRPRLVPRAPRGSRRPMDYPPKQLLAGSPTFPPPSRGLHWKRKRAWSLR